MIGRRKVECLLEGATAMKKSRGNRGKGSLAMRKVPGGLTRGIITMGIPKKSSEVERG